MCSYEDMICLDDEADPELGVLFMMNFLLCTLWSIWCGIWLVALTEGADKVASPKVHREDDDPDVCLWYYVMLYEVIYDVYEVIYDVYDVIYDVWCVMIWYVIMWCDRIQLDMLLALSWQLIRCPR